MIRVEEEGYDAAVFDLEAGRLSAVQVVRVWDGGSRPSCRSRCRDCTLSRSSRGQWVCSQTIVGHVEMPAEELARADPSAFTPFPVFLN